MAFVSTLGASNANSYISVAEAEALIADLPQSDGLSDWSNLIDGDKEKTLVAATFSIEPLPWRGTICSTTQNLAWPRQVEHDSKITLCTALPYDFTLAVAYTAAYMGQVGGYMQVAPGGGAVPPSGSEAIPGLTPSDLEGYEKVSLGKGAIELTLAKPSEIQSGTQYLPPFATDLLAKYVAVTDGLTSKKVSIPRVAGIRVPFISSPGIGRRFQIIDGRLYAPPGKSLTSFDW